MHYTSILIVRRSQFGWLKSQKYCDECTRVMQLAMESYMQAVRS